MSEVEKTYIDPSYTLAGGRPLVVDGITFRPYRTGILRYSRISDDGKIMVRQNVRSTGHLAFVIGHGQLLGKTGKAKHFRFEETAYKEAIKVFKARPSQ